MINEQLELGFGAGKIRTARQQNRVARGSWWFAQMRQIVSNAMDWETAGEPRPEQIWIPGARREVKV